VAVTCFVNGQVLLAIIESDEWVTLGERDDFREGMILVSGCFWWKSGALAPRQRQKQTGL